jgi:hypothetical protein
MADRRRSRPRIVPWLGVAIALALLTAGWGSFRDGGSIRDVGADAVNTTPEVARDSESVGGT